MNRLKTSLLLLVAATALVVGLAVRSADADPAAVLEATVVPVQREAVKRSYPSIDHGSLPGPEDDRQGTTKWRHVASTGNCCENYLTATRQGRLLEFGGTYVRISDDRGLTWKQVQPLTPLVNGEGTVVMAPNGDILGIGWDPYSGDHLQSFKYEAFSGKWFYNELPLHTPFYDREWITVVPGPFSIDGQTVPYISFLRGGYPSKELYLWSSDGLDYTEASSKFIDGNGQTPVNKWLTTKPDPSFDWIQPNSNTGLTPLGGGAVLARPDQGGWALLDPATLTWKPYRYGNGQTPQGRHQVDSAGRIHNVIAGGNSFDYRISSNGGETWNTLRVQLPAGLSIEHWDFRANKNAGVAAVVVHAAKAGGVADQDLAYKLDIRTDQPALKRSYTIGLGDVNSTAGVQNTLGSRLDFETVTILPGGTIAISFLDSTTWVIDYRTGERREAPAPNIAIALESYYK